MSRVDLVNKHLLAVLAISAKKWFTRKFCETLTCKYRKSSKNNKFNKILDLEREKAKKGLEKSINSAKIAKVTFLLLLRYLQVSASQKFLVNQFFFC